MDGREVLRRGRDAGTWTPIVMLTQVGEAGERAMTLDEGADDFLNKPFDPVELIAPWPLPAVVGDADLLLVAVYNVVANAIKYTADDHIIEVRVGTSVYLQLPAG